MRYITCLTVSFLLFFCSNSTNNDNNDQSEGFTARINSSEFMADSVNARLVYYDIGVMVPGWKVYMDAYNDSNIIRITLDRFTTDGQKIPETTYNLHALTNSAFLSHGYKINNAYIGLSVCFEGFVEITNCNTYNQTISGRFAFKSNYPASTSEDTVVVSDGVFGNIPYTIND